MTKKAPKSLRLTDTDPEDSNDDDEEKEPIVKKVSKSLGLVENRPKELRGLRHRGYPNGSGFSY